MNIETIKEIELELKRFNQRLKEAKYKYSDDPHNFILGCKQTAALKRASKDLSEVLIKLRK